jgi:hypothetical protein
MSCLVYLEMLQEQYENAVATCKQRNKVINCNECKLVSMCGLMR